MGEVYYIYRRGRKIAVRDLDIGPVPRKRRQDYCVLVPELWVEKLLPALSTSATRWLAVVLLLKAFQQRGQTFTCADLREFGVTRWQKDKGLIELERAGLIAVERAQHRAPRIKMLVN